MSICSAALVSSHFALLQIAVLGDGQCHMCIDHMVFSPQSTVGVFIIDCKILLYVWKFSFSFGSCFYLLELEMCTYMENMQYH